MIKKIIIIGLAIWGLIIFYNKFLADTLGNFFQSNKDKVDFFKTESPTTNRMPDF